MQVKMKSCWRILMNPWYWDEIAKCMQNVCTKRSWKWVIAHRELLDERTQTLFIMTSFEGIYNLGIQIRNMKMVFNIHGTWRRVIFEKLMMMIYDFFYSAKSLSRPYNIVQKSLRRLKIFYTMTKRLSRIKKIINFHH